MNEERAWTERSFTAVRAALPAESVSAFDAEFKRITRAPVVDLTTLDEFLAGWHRIAVRAAADPEDWRLMHEEAAAIESGWRPVKLSDLRTTAEIHEQDMCGAPEYRGEWIRARLEDAFPWVRFLPEHETDAFVTEALRAGNAATFVAVVGAWKDTAEAYADPELLETLTTPIDDAEERTWTEESVRALGVRTTVPIAGKVIAGWERTVSYNMAKRGEFPVPVVKVGRRLVVPVAPILELLRIKTPEGDSPQPAEVGERDQRARQLWAEAAEHADPDEVARMMAFIDAQLAGLPDVFWQRRAALADKRGQGKTGSADD